MPVWCIGAIQQPLHFLFVINTPDLPLKAEHETQQWDLRESVPGGLLVMILFSKTRDAMESNASFLYNQDFLVIQIYN